MQRRPPMGAPDASTDLAADVAVVGAGHAGLGAALALAEAGFSIALIGATERPGQGRTVALLEPSIAILKRLGAWEAIAPSAAALRTLTVVDATGSPWPARPVSFRAKEVGLAAFGYNVEAAPLAEALETTLLARARVARLRALAIDFSFGPDSASLALADGRKIGAKLIVGADGRHSPTRKAAGVDTTLTSYSQSALTVTLAHSRPHGDASTEFHRRGGPFTLVPLPPRNDAPHRSSLVWVMRASEGERWAQATDDALARAIEEGSHNLVGRVAAEGQRGLFPLSMSRARSLTANRMALVGESAHALPPIGAQGLNLSMRDVDALAAALKTAATSGRDIGGNETLAAYERARRTDVAFRAAAIDAVNRSLLVDFAPIDMLRGLGLTAIGAIGPLRRAAMRAGLGPTALANW